MAKMQPRWDQNSQRWECSLGSGKRRTWFRTKVKGEEGRLLCIQKRDAALHGPKPLPPGSLAEFIESVWWPRVKAKTTKSTQDGYRSILRREIARFYLWQIADLRLEVLQAWVSGMTQEAKTVANVYRVMSGILELAHKTGRYPRLDHKLVVLPETSVAQDVPGLEPENIEKILQGAKGTIWEGPIWAAAFLGLRRNEACGLKKGHVKILGDSATITLQDNRQTHGETKKLKSKRAGDTRTLNVPRSFAERLMSFADHDGIYIFHGKTGKPIWPNSLTANTPKVCERAGAVKVSYKDLRTACATNLRAAGVSHVVIMQILGHSTIEASLRYQKVRASEQLEAFLGVTASGGRG